MPLSIDIKPIPATEQHLSALAENLQAILNANCECGNENRKQKEIGVRNPPRSPNADISTAKRLRRQEQF